MAVYPAQVLRARRRRRRNRGSNGLPQPARFFPEIKWRLTASWPNCSSAAEGRAFASGEASDNKVLIRSRRRRNRARPAGH